MHLTQTLTQKVLRLGKNSRFLAGLDLQSEEGCKLIFNYFDNDKDGVLDNSETRRFLEKLWKQKVKEGREESDTTARDEFVEDLIDQLDVFDGKLSWSDLLRRRDVIIQTLADLDKDPGPVPDDRGRRKTNDNSNGIPTRRSTRSSSLLGKKPKPPPEKKEDEKVPVNSQLAVPPKGATKAASEKRASEWIKKHTQFAKFAHKFAYTTWEQLLEYSLEDLKGLGVPSNAAVPLAKVIAALKEEARISVSEKSKSSRSITPESGVPADYELDSPRPTFSYNNRVFSTDARSVTLDALFQELDTEHKGTIGEKEMTIALRRYGVVDPDQSARAWFQDIDRDGDGLVDQQAFVEFMSYAHDAIFQVPGSINVADCETEESAVFLGGSCNPTSWRQDIVIPLFKKAGVSFYNPQREDWHEGLVAMEARAKSSAAMLFFVIDPLTLALASMIECTELITSNRPLVLVINDLPLDSKLASGEEMPAQVRKDANRARAYLADVALRHHIQPYSSISRAACEVVQFLHGGWMGGYEEGRDRSSTIRVGEEQWRSLATKMSGRPPPLVRTKAAVNLFDDGPDDDLLPKSPRASAMSVTPETCRPSVSVSIEPSSRFESANSLRPSTSMPPLTPRTPSATPSATTPRSGRASVTRFSFTATPSNGERTHLPPPINSPISPATTPSPSPAATMKTPPPPPTTATTATDHIKPPPLPPPPPTPPPGSVSTPPTKGVCPHQAVGGADVECSICKETGEKGGEKLVQRNRLTSMTGSASWMGRTSSSASSSDGLRSLHSTSDSWIDSEHGSLSDDAVAGVRPPPFPRPPGAPPGVPAGSSPPRFSTLYVHTDDHGVPDDTGHTPPSPSVKGHRPKERSGSGLPSFFDRSTRAIARGSSGGMSASVGGMSAAAIASILSSVGQDDDHPPPTNKREQSQERGKRHPSLTRRGTRV